MSELNQNALHSSRKMATIRRVSALKPIEGADKIELAIVDGWQVVVKKGQFEVNEAVCYLEIDSWVPNDIAPFLTKSGHYPKIYQGIEGQRLKTVKLRGELSQGLLLSIDDMVVAKGCWSPMKEGADASEWLGVIKWEQEIPAQLAGMMRGGWPAALRKTDQERIQNLTKKFEELKNHLWEKSEKLHGCSATFYLDAEGEFHVLSRNVDLKETEGNTYWDVARKYDIENIMRNAVEEGKQRLDNFTSLAIQGEIIGPGINGNQYGLTTPEFYVFDLFDPDQQTYCPGPIRVNVVAKWGLKHVPIIAAGKIPAETTIEELLKDAEGKSAINGSEREGCVYKSYDDPEVSFKCVSNLWLCNNDG